MNNERIYLGKELSAERGTGKSESAREYIKRNYKSDEVVYLNETEKVHRYPKEIHDQSIIIKEEIIKLKEEVDTFKYKGTELTKRIKSIIDKILVFYPEGKTIFYLEYFINKLFGHDVTNIKLGIKFTYFDYDTKSYDFDLVVTIQESKSHYYMYKQNTLSYLACGLPDLSDKEMVINTLLDAERISMDIMIPPTRFMMRLLTDDTYAARR